jgi:hypothetical protein
MRNLTGFFCLIVLLSFVFLSFPACAQETGTHTGKDGGIENYQLKIYDSPAIIRELIRHEDEGRIDLVVKTFRNIADGEEMREAILWLRTRVMADDTPDPRYALLYAETLMRLIGVRQEEQKPLMETAAMVYLYGQLTMAVDAQRCLDRQAGWPAASALARPFEGLVEFYRKQPKESRRDILSVAMRLEERIASRPPNIWICRGPAEVEIPATESGGVEQEIFLLVEEFELHPRFVSEHIWQERRQARRRAFIRQFK